MTNENELKADDVLSILDSLDRFLMIPNKIHLDNVKSLIKQQQSRIELLESAIREFNDADNDFILAREDQTLGDKHVGRLSMAKSKLSELMENKS